MSFYTSLTGLNAATAMLGVTSNNIANVGTTGFKRSRADFGDIFATSPLQKASSTVGQGVSLKQVSQEFGQGNISFSANALDLAITGDGFFPMRSADGLQEIFTRNGSFLLNEQFNVVNSAGQRLMAATVDSTGSANVNERVVLTIPQKTSGEAKQTSLVSLGLNFPADASVVTESFNRTNPATFNKSTAFTVYDNGGNGYLATIYYVKTANANQSSPYNKWQTHVFVGEDQVDASLVQATDTNSQKLYVNQYGEIKPYSEVKDELTTAKTQLFSLDELTDKRVSVPATISGKAITEFDLSGALKFTDLSPANKGLLASMFELDVDGTGKPVAVDLSGLSNSSAQLTGTAIASEVTKVLNQKFGDETFFDLTDASSRTFTLTDGRVTAGTPPVPTPVVVNLTPGSNGLPANSADFNRLTINQVVHAIQEQLNAAPGFGGAANSLKVSYDYSTQGFKFFDGTNQLTLKSGIVKNDVFGLTPTPVDLDENGLYGVKVLPNSSSSIRLSAEQRFGMKMTYDSVNKVFSLASGTTGDKSSIQITRTNALAQSLLGLNVEDTTVLTSSVALRGIASSAAVAFGTTPTINISNNFSVDNTNNSFVVTVDGVKGTVVIPTGNDYSLESFMAKLQKGINALATTTDGAPVTVNGVKVTYDSEKKSFRVYHGYDLSGLIH